MSPLLNKSFNSDKCKTLLRLIVKKFGILRNKHIAVARSSRAEVARLLEKRQDSSAKARVENVFREEKIVALYNLLEQLSQLVIDRFESVKGQRECPSELKEAVASLIYAAEGCGEVEELKKVSKYFSKKFGTQFFLSAKELRPSCGVNTQVIQNLSSQPLSSDVQMKLLKEIAVENKIKWDYEVAVANSSMLSADVLDGPSRFVSGTQVSPVSTHTGSHKQMSASMSRPGNEASERLGEIQDNSFSSYTMSPRAPSDSQRPNMHHANSEMRNSRTQNSQSLKGVPEDPYMLAKAQGKMDYAFVAEYMGRQQPLVKEHINTERVAKHEGQSMPPGQSRKKQSSRQETEVCLLDLEAAAEAALLSASEAAEAARVAVTMVLKDSSERDLSHSTNNDNERYPGSNCVPVLEEASSAIASARIPSMQHNPSANLVVNDHVPEGASGLSLKYVVFGQSPSVQLEPSQVRDSPELEDKDSTSLPSSPIRNFRTIGEEEEVAGFRTQCDWKDKGSFSKIEAQHDNNVSNVPLTPQFDEFSSDEDLQEETAVNPLKNASAVSNVDELEIQQDKHVHTGQPQFDDESSEEEIPFYFKGRPAMVKEDDAELIPSVYPRKSMTSSVLDDDWMEGGSSTSLQDTMDLSRLDHNSSLKFSQNDGKQGTRGKSTRLQVDVPIGGYGLVSNIAQNDRFDMDVEHEMVRLSLSSYESSHWDTNFDKIPSLVRRSPTRHLSSGDDERDPSYVVRRNLKWCSEDDPLGSPKLSDRAESPKPDIGLSPQGVQVSPSKYQGLSKRSIRPTQPSPNQDIQSKPLE